MAQQTTPPTPDQFISLLKKKGLKATSQRMAVHEVMCELGHASADAVSSIITERGHKVSVASVYNILSQMSDIGIYQRRLSPGSKMYFDVMNVPHLHLFDSVNEEYMDVFDEEILDFIESKIRRRRFKGYKVDSVDVELVCHPTRKKTITK